MPYSVLMSVYFKEQPNNLQQAMESMRNQTVPTDDFVLVCDGPLTDELDDVITEEQEKFGSVLHVHRLEKNGGLGNALNEGLKVCKNELVARMDSDDISRPGRCEKQLRLFSSYPDISLSSGTVSEFADNPAHPTGKREVPITDEEIRTYSRTRNPMNHPCVMFKKSAVEKAGGYKETFHLFEDYYLWVRMLMKGYKARNTREVLLDMRSPADMYLRRGGRKYEQDMLRFHKWMLREGWSSWSDYLTGAVPHAVVCVLPNGVRKLVYEKLHGWGNSMQIGILTYYGVHNHGAALQANALKSVLQKLGHDVSFLSFERSYEYISAEQTKKYKIGPSSIPYYFKFMQEKGIGNILYNVQKNKTLNTFRNSQFRFVPYDQFDGDVTVVGSDEVFSLEIGYNSFMYGYGLKSRNVISYSGSFGPSTIEEISEKGKNEQIRDGLNKFKAISVRDQNSQGIVKALCGKDVPLTCDPVLLYGYKKEQRRYAPKTPKYIAIYAYDHRMNDPEEVNAIKEYAKKHNLKVYSIAYYHKWCDRNINVDPIQLLGWMKNAELVITDTFHGSVISIICNSPLVVKTRESNENKLSYLLDEYGLSDRKLKDFSDLEDISKEQIDFDAVNQKVSEKRKESLSYLKNALESCK